jgi:ABC-type nickel/cobalt efflux system permease component RcnA
LVVDCGWLLIVVGCWLLVVGCGWMRLVVCQRGAQEKEEVERKRNEPARGSKGERVWRGVSAICQRKHLASRRKLGSITENWGIDCRKLGDNRLQKTGIAEHWQLRKTQKTGER